MTSNVGTPKPSLNCRKKTVLAKRVKAQGGSTTITRGPNKGNQKKKSGLIAWLRSHKSTKSKKSKK